LKGEEASYVVRGSSKQGRGEERERDRERERDTKGMREAPSGRRDEKRKKRRKGRFCQDTFFAVVVKSMSLLPLLFLLALVELSWSSSAKENIPPFPVGDYPFFEIAAKPESLRIGVLFRPDECDYKTKKGDRISIRYTGRLKDGYKVSLYFSHTLSPSWIS
jgi:hypothetical protein